MWSDWWHKQKNNDYFIFTFISHLEIFFWTDTTKPVAFLLMSTRFLFFLAQKWQSHFWKISTDYLSTHFYWFQRFRCSTVCIFVATSTVLQVWTLSDVLSLCCGRDFDHVIWGADKLWRYLTAYFLILKVYIKLYVRTKDIAHHIWIEITEIWIWIYFFSSVTFSFFSFFKHNKLLTRKLRKIFFVSSLRQPQSSSTAEYF